MKIQDLYTASSIAEGYCDCEHTARDELNAWAYLIKTGDAYRLQGWYGRNAESLIEQGIVTRKGELTAYAEEKLQEAGL